jgi:hypothetical protein
MKQKTIKIAMMTELQIFEQLKRKYDAEMVSALVGAGFTKNAYTKALSWTGLLMDLVEDAYEDELHAMYQQYTHMRFGVDVEPYEKLKESFEKKIIARDGYLNVVSKYIEHKGFREAIDYYIETHNPFFYKRTDGMYGVKGDDVTVLTDKDFTIHQRFLYGKWQYIFTTNFDNALEFTNEQYNMGYVTIKADYEMSQKKMAHSIVKIHGSLIPFDETLSKPFVFDGDHSGRYIISREDFENYFKRHEAFSYLLRVALLSGSYCLLGFSGDDPNFISWLNWVKDILDKDTKDEDTDEAGDDKQLVLSGEDDIKVFLILTDNKPLSEEQKLYYKNHHIGIIHLDTPEIRARLRYSEHADTSFKIDHLLKEIVGTQVDASDELKESPTPKPTVTSIWRRLYNKLTSNENIGEEFENLISCIKEQGYAKGINFQEYVLDELLKKDSSTWSENDKNTLLLAMTDIGLTTSSIPELVASLYEGQGEWQLMKIHEATLMGANDEVEEGKDADVLENILRKLYHYDFKAAKEMLETWKPQGRYGTVKASLNYYYNRDESIKSLDSIIMNTENTLERYTASLIYNCIDSGFIATYPLNVYRNKGLTGLNDVLLSTIEELKKKKEDIDTYGTETVYLHADGDDYVDPTDVRRSFRFLNLVSNDGFNLCYGISNIINVADWYLIFRNLYCQYPYPCLYYSSQYNSKKVLRRIGQDFAFEGKLQEILPDMMHQVLAALQCQDTPVVMRSGILQIGSQMFFGMKEELWFNVFFNYFSTTYVEEEGKYIYSGDAKSFVSSALVCLHENDNINKCVTVLLGLFEKAPDDVIDKLEYRTRLNKLDALNDEQIELLEKIAANSTLRNTSMLLNIFDDKHLLPEEIKETFVRSFIVKEEELEKSDNITLLNFCRLAEGMNDVVGKLKDIILKRNIWDSGVGVKWITDAHPFYIMHLGESFMWSLVEMVQIYENLKTNLKKLTPKTLKGVIWGSQYKNLLMEMKIFAEKNKIVDEEIKKDIEEKLAIVRHFNQIEEGLYSSNPEAVENATGLLNQEYREGRFEENRDNFNILLSKGSMMNTPGLTDCLVTISVAIHFCGDVIRNDGVLLKSLYRLLLQYKDKDLRDLDLQVIHAGHSLLVIAEFLSATELNDANIAYWLNNTNLTRLNFLEF